MINVSVIYHLLHIQLNIQLNAFKELLPNVPRRKAAKLAKVPKKIRNVEGRQCSGKHHLFNRTSHGSQNGQVKFCARSGSQVKDWTKNRESIFWCLFQCQNVPLMVSIKKSLYIYIPIGSMYAIYGYIYHPYTTNVSIYTSTMDPSWDIYIYIGFEP